MVATSLELSWTFESLKNPFVLTGAGSEYEFCRRSVSF